ncbi:AAA family ATPase [Candidatus Arthromitus sp. SFB-mouse]|uniref:AAA family ATPase n=1 Tax=Candidatus Arthromitus sp. SFB-mouse TaxID=49118 RepID=UPI001FA6F118|nr:AAA family ATPase [Candidatus Arthromitus sp. SFB-mouse]
MEQENQPLQIYYKKQYENNEKYDIRIFQGFDILIGKNENLNCITLSNENSKINKEIEKKESLILENQKKIEEINKKINNPLNNEKNLFSMKEERIAEFKKQKIYIDNALKRFASEIKGCSYKIHEGNKYDINDIKNDIKNMGNNCLLSEYEIDKFNNILKLEKKNLNEIYETPINIIQISNEVEQILKDRVKPQKIISKLNNDPKKSNFAKYGLDIHKVGEKCGFCGSIITADILNELENYFSGTEIKQFENKIEDKCKELEGYKKILESINIDLNNLYTDKNKRVQEIDKKINEKKLYYINLLEKYIQKLKKKRSELFDEIELDLPELLNEDKKLSDYIAEYNKLVREHNSNDLLKIKKEAREKIRYNEIKKYLDGFKYGVEIEKMNNLEYHKKNVEEDYFNKEEARKKLMGEIDNFKKDIINLKNRMKNVEKAVNNINKKLRTFVSFELSLYNENEQKERAFYRVKCLRSSKYRSVKELSTGEKNIIAFLYFIEQFKDIEREVPGSIRVMVFDDPMSSNDDTKQYLIINDLQRIMRKIEREDDKKLIILTHNCHFYLNVKHDRKYEDDKLEYINDNKISKFIKLISDGKKTNIEYVKKREDDFTTSYDLLWKELGNLYNNNASSDILYNPMRRILETYIKFNCLDQGGFYENSPFFKKACDVNSHSIDDFEHDLSGISKIELINDFKSCLEKNHGEKHFKEYSKKYKIHP